MCSDLCPERASLPQESRLGGSTEHLLPEHPVVHPTRSASLRQGRARAGGEGWTRGMFPQNGECGRGGEGRKVR